MCQNFIYCESVLRLRYRNMLKVPTTHVFGTGALMGENTDVFDSGGVQRILIHEFDLYSLMCHILTRIWFSAKTC